MVFPLRSPLISSKLCPFFILTTCIVAIADNSTELIVLKLVEYQGKLVCERHWNEVFGESVAEGLATTPREHRLSHHSFRPCARRNGESFLHVKSVVVFDNKEIRVRDMVAERLHPLPKRRL